MNQERIEMTSTEQIDPRLRNNTCKQCGQSQVEPDGNGGERVAPMVHTQELAVVGNAVIQRVVSYHLDCLPADIEALHVDKHGDRIQAAKDGVRGDDLRAVPDNHNDDEVDLGYHTETQEV
jgi:hypothetical protein